jgi:hypothetical protein
LIKAISHLTFIDLFQAITIRVGDFPYKTGEEMRQIYPVAAVLALPACVLELLELICIVFIGVQNPNIKHGFRLFAGMGHL